MYHLNLHTPLTYFINEIYDDNIHTQYNNKFDIASNISFTMITDNQCVGNTHYTNWLFISDILSRQF